MFRLASCSPGEKNLEPTGSNPSVKTGGFIALLALYSIL